MSYPTDRIMLFDRGDNPIGDIGPDELTRRVMVEEINGEHSLTIETTRVIADGTRALTVDGTGRWREWALDEPDELHQSGECATGTYYFTWSLAHDLAVCYGRELRPGIPVPTAAGTAMAAALDPQSRWGVGTVDVATLAGASMYDISSLERVSRVLEKWGGEVDAEISVDSRGVTSRSVALRAHLGSDSATRRFDWSRDVSSIRRIPPAGPRYCRIIPRGRGEEVYDEGGEVSGYTRRIDIKDVNGGVEYLRDEEAELAFRQPDGHGGWHYPVKLVIYEDIEDPQELKDAALADLHNHTRPVVTYESDVVQLARAGMDAKGVALGDDVQIVDRGFNAGSALRLQGRVVRIEVDELSPETGTKLTIGEIGQRLSDVMGDIARRTVGNLGSRLSAIEAGGTAEYLRRLLNHLNDEINVTGGYAYITEGQGIHTYDRAVSDPLVGSEATKVVEIKGGSVRIADSRTSSGDWNWKTVFVSGHIAAELVTAVNVVAGWLGNASGTYIDLDSNTANFGPVSGYHFTVDTNGIRHWYGGTLLGQYLSTSMQLGKSTDVHIAINPSGLEVFDSSNASVLFAGIENNTSIVRVGRTSNSGNVVMSGDGSVSVRYGSTVGARFGYGDVHDVDHTGVIKKGTYLTIGTRGSSPTQGEHSIAAGRNNVVSGFGAISGGMSNTVNGNGSIACGSDNFVVGKNSAAFGNGLYVGYNDRLACGSFNSKWDAYAGIFSVGSGSSDSSRATCFYVTSNSVWTSGQYYSDSDKRLKEHLSYLGEDAASFIRALKPALYLKDGSRHVGFYAQEVQEAEPGEWNTETVHAGGHTDESLDFDPLTLDYNALVAPLVAYCQQLERRIDQQQKTIDDLITRIERLEARA